MPNNRDWRYLVSQHQARMFPPQEGAQEPTTKHAPDFALHFYSDGTQLVAIAVTPSGNVHPLQPQDGTFSFTIADKVVSFQIAPEAMPGQMVNAHADDVTPSGITLEDIIGGDGLLGG